MHYQICVVVFCCLLWGFFYRPLLIPLFQNAPSNTVVIDLDATYENQPENTNFTYAITHGDLNAFSIHQELGIIATLKPLDRETTDEYTVSNSSRISSFSHFYDFFVFRQIDAPTSI